MDAKRRFLQRVVASGLEHGILAPDDVLRHVTPSVLAHHLPPELLTRVLAAGLGGGAMNPQVVVDTLGPAELAAHVPTSVLWACVHEAGSRALGDTSNQRPAPRPPAPGRPAPARGKVPARAAGKRPAPGPAPRMGPPAAPRPAFAEEDETSVREDRDDGDWTDVPIATDYDVIEEDDSPDAVVAQAAGEWGSGPVNPQTRGP